MNKIIYVIPSRIAAAPPSFCNAFMFFRGLIEYKIDERVDFLLQAMDIKMLFMIIRKK
ncbi:hypothetical protein GCM10022258_40080 [Aquimarina gracilis]